MSDNFNPDLGWSDPYRKGLIRGIASEEKRKERITICESCEFFKLFFCKSCGCYLPFKTRIQDSKCPEKKW